MSLALDHLTVASRDRHAAARLLAGILGVQRLHAQGVAFRSTPHGPVDRQVNTAHAGRIVDWHQPDGHVWEALTVSYARPHA